MNGGLSDDMSDDNADSDDGGASAESLLAIGVAGVSLALAPSSRSMRAGAGWSRRWAASTSTLPGRRSRRKGQTERWPCEMARGAWVEMPMSEAREHRQCVESGRSRCSSAECPATRTNRMRRKSVE